MGTIFSELKRRNVIRVALAYIVVAWLLLQVADVVLNNIEAPSWIFQVILLVVALGFPFALIFAWAYELTPEGLKKEKDVDRSQSITPVTGRKLDFIIIGILVLVLGYFATDKFMIGASTDESSASIDGEVTGTKIPQMSIAVLPFVNMSSDPEQEFFSDGISEELLNMLAQFPGLRVAARTSSFQFKGQNQDIGKIADTLNVAHVLEGSVRKAGTRLRITAQLIEADSGYHLWSDTYDRELDDIFTVQDEIATAISDALKVKLALDAAETTIHPESIKAANTQAYEAFLRGRRLIHERGRAALEEAVRHLEQSLRLDNNFAPAHAQLAIATALLLESPESYGDLSLEQVKRVAIPHLDRALELEPNLAEGFAGRALMALNTDDLDVAIKYARKALDANPSYIDAMNWLYLALGGLGRYEDQLLIMDRILETDPLTRVGRANYIGFLGSQGRSDEGHRVADELVEQNPWSGYARHAEMSILHEADFANGVLYGLRAYEVEPTDIFSNNVIVQLFSWIGEYEEARRITDVLDATVDLYKGRFDEAIATTQRKLMFDPENSSIISDAADALYLARRIDEALPLYERLREFRPPGRPLEGSLTTTMRYANALRITGDEQGARAARDIAAKDYESLSNAGYVAWFFKYEKAMIAAFDRDAEGAVVALAEAFERGMRNPAFHIDSIFDEVRNDPGFLKVRQKIDADLAKQRAAILQTICFDNPVPHAWRPLPETCADVTRL
jgi:TolB-like protein